MKRNAFFTGSARLPIIALGLGAIAALIGLALSLARSRSAYWTGAAAPPEKFRGYSLDFIAPFYDWFANLGGFSRRFRRRTVELAGIKPGERVLDVGTGTGELALYEKDAAGPTGLVAGIDIAPRMIQVAREKSLKSGKEIGFEVASIESLPFPEAFFDVVTSSMMMHHLPTDVKRTGLAEVYRALKPGGRLLIVDLGPAHPLLVLVASILGRLLFFVPELTFGRDNLQGKIPELVRQAGFHDIQVVAKPGFAGLSLPFILARKPDGQAPNSI